MTGWIIAAACLASANGVVTVEMQAERDVVSSVVRLGDVAKLSGPPAIARQLAKLDVAEVNEGRAAISRELVSLRLTLAGYSADRCRVHGADVCHVQRVEAPDIHERVSQEIAKKYALTFAVMPAEVRVTMVDAIRLPGDDPLCEFAVEIRDAEQLGDNRVTVTMTTRYGETSSQSVRQKVELARHVPVLTRDLRRGELIQQEDVDWPRQFISDAKLVLLEEDVVGHTVERSWRAGEMLKRGDVVSPTTLKLVRANSRVRCTARTGRLTVTMPQVIALDDGARGQSIRLRNPVSQRQFTGVVVSAEEVEVLLP
ncbi:MAG: flagellar basal body P-ring formation protein FlgA [Planctomycetales bacterium]|nr:flagellar basal body P-ring formation protein FlgA [Planctomycetales bacterium]